MGFEWSIENQYFEWVAPKLILAGRIQGSLDGQPVLLSMGDEGILFSVNRLSTLGKSAKLFRAQMPKLLSFCNHFRLELTVESASFGRWRLTPEPSLLTRILMRYWLGSSANA